VAASGCKLLVADERYASRAVSAVIPPDGVDAEALRKEAQGKWGVVFAGGQGNLKGKLFRITHLGYTDPKDTFAALACLELSLRALGHRADLGRAVAAAQEVYLQKEAVTA
jgi:aspartate aminotransferase-like enzyme